jgi:protein gp37
MADKSKIEWLRGSDDTQGSTWNPVRARNRKTGKVGWFCTKPSPGCKGCYAERMNVQAGNNPGRMGNGIAYAIDKLDQVEIFLDEKTLLQPLHWRKGRLIFPCSMTDWQADFVPDEFRDKMLAIMALTPQHTYLTLTKRADRQRGYLQQNSTGGHIFHVASQFGNPASGTWPLPNHWVGVSAENQKYADLRIPELLQTPAAVRWVSAEPLLGPIDLSCWSEEGLECGECQWRGREDQAKLIEDPPDDSHFNCPRCGEICAHTPLDELLGAERGINWLVCGGESGPGARPIHPDWARSLRDQCAAAGVPFFFKQWGEWGPGEIVADDRRYPTKQYFNGEWEECSDDWATEKDNGSILYRVGKKAAGRLLDGKEHNEYPEVMERKSI